MTDSILVSVQLLEHRDGVRRLLRDQYHGKVAPFRQVLAGLAKERGQSLARVAFDLSQEMDAAGHDPSLVFAAFVDEAEGGAA
jgi:hypothetical protein